MKAKALQSYLACMPQDSEVYIHIGFDDRDNPIYATIANIYVQTVEELHTDSITHLKPSEKVVIILPENA